MRRFVSGTWICLALGLAAAGTAGCGPNACQVADEDIAAKHVGCDPNLAIPSDALNVQCTEEKAEELGCRADCYEAASCETLKGGSPTGSAALAACLDAC